MLNQKHKRLLICCLLFSNCVLATQNNPLKTEESKSFLWGEEEKTISSPEITDWVKQLDDEIAQKCKALNTTEQEVRTAVSENTYKGAQDALNSFHHFRSFPKNGNPEDYKLCKHIFSFDLLTVARATWPSEEVMYDKAIPTIDQWCGPKIQQRIDLLRALLKRDWLIEFKEMVHQCATLLNFSKEQRDKIKIFFDKPSFIAKENWRAYSNTAEMGVHFTETFLGSKETWVDIAHELQHLKQKTPTCALRPFVISGYLEHAVSLAATLGGVFCSAVLLACIAKNCQKKPASNLELSPTMLFIVGVLSGLGGIVNLALTDRILTWRKNVWKEYDAEKTSLTQMCPKLQDGARILKNYKKDWVEDENAVRKNFKQSRWSYIPLIGYPCYHTIETPFHPWSEQKIAWAEEGLKKIEQNNSGKK